MNSYYNSKDEIREMYKRGRDLTKVNRIPPIDTSVTDDPGRPKRVAVYCRVSTDGIGQTVSFEIQKKYYIKYVRSQPNWKLVGLYSDEGISATTTKNRVGLQMLIQDAKIGKIDLIVIKSISRFCRNLEDSIRIINELKALPRPVGIFFETERISTLDPSMDMLTKVFSMIAEGESRKKSEAIIGSLRARYSEGFFLIYDILGYKRTGVNKISIDEEEAATVRLIYEMYLAGYTEYQIAEVLIELGRKKHTHHYIDGKIKEGTIDWNASSVRNIFDNEKRCGDVLAQKTYTYDCIEHIVRKNVREVAQYYGVDQHEAIISREEFYLAQRLRESNKGGWTKGIQVLRTFVSGPLKGFVRVIPGWYGFDESDYVAASLNAYGVTIPQRPLYPDYVTGSIEEIHTAKEKTKEDIEFSHYYAVSEQEFLSEPIITPDEYEQLIEKEPEYLDALIKLKEDLSSRKVIVKPYKGLARAWKFSMKEKKLVTFDRCGISFNSACYEVLNADAVEMYYNPVEETVVVTKCENADINAPEAINWRREIGGHFEMIRCSTPAICAVIFMCMNWDRNNKYTLFGRKKVADGKVVLEFSLGYPIVRVKYMKETPVEQMTVMDRIEIAMEEAKNIGAFYSENEENPEKYADYLTDKVDNKSRAVYFLDESINSETRISLIDYESEKYDPQFIKTLKEKDIIPVEGWDYLDGRIRWFEDGFELYPVTMPSGRTGSYSDEPGESVVQDFGWTMNYVFPTKQEVEESIKRLRV
jgi:DNA invertase Pin-like site-specific DNA recombinase